ncbi:hypothetical protein V6Z11_A13G099000 [Gossypium hirsutum]|uniref:Indole-3-acetic acid-induced protein ARG7 n=3 Tax=Gossypium TaxID=3633 RepID=A0A1U8IAV6_GOSHI|nr:indole-3-acetic acid-induced protein ARG7-like [Gossypium hirsutum]
MDQTSYYTRFYSIAGLLVELLVTCCIAGQRSTLPHSFNIPHLIDQHFPRKSYIFIYRGTNPSKTKKTMAIHLHRIVSVNKVPKGYFAVYVGENQKRFVIPVSFLNQLQFQKLLGLSEEEFGYSHSTRGLTIPCNEDMFLQVTFCLN